VRSPATLACHRLVRPALLHSEHDLITIGSEVGVGAVSRANLERRDLRSYPVKAATGSELRRRATFTPTELHHCRRDRSSPSVCTAALLACGPPRLRSGRVGYRNAPFCHPAAFRNGRRCRRQLVDQGMSNLSIVNWRPSQKRNARLIDAISAPSRPHSSFVGSRCCCRAETSPSRAAVKSAMTVSFRSSAKLPRVRANHGVSVNIVLPPNHWFGATVSRRISGAPPSEGDQPERVAPPTRCKLSIRRAGARADLGAPSISRHPGHIALERLGAVGRPSASLRQRAKGRPPVGLWPPHPSGTAMAASSRTRSGPS